jgi:DNA repair exonuclease SbcCD nuclease subunit
LIRILHAADFHLDSPFAALSEDKAAERRREMRGLLYAVTEIAAQADIVLLPGDLFDSGRAYWETAEVLSDVFSKIKARIFIAPGNHDYYASKSPYSHLKLPENVHIFNSTEISGVEVSELGCVVWGRAFISEWSDSPLRGFKAPDNGKINIMALHGDTALPDSPYGYISRTDISESGLDYLALGHIHTFSGIQKAGRTFWAYPGCNLGRGFDETGAKGLITGTVGSGECELEFIPLNGRRYEKLTIDISGYDNATEAVLSSLPGGCERDVYRLILTGQTHERLKPEEIKAAIAGRFDYVEIKDETQLSKDVWEAAGEDTLKGNFLRILRGKYDSASGEAEREEIVLAARYGLAALEYREEV